MQIINMETESGKAVMEIDLSDCLTEETIQFWSIYLWDEKDLPVFCCRRDVKEEEPCIIRIFHPKLWEGVKAPHRYRLEVYFADSDSQIKLYERRFVALYHLKEVPFKGWFLNGREFEIKGVYYDCPCNIFDTVCPGAEGGLEMVVDKLVQMGANMIVIGTTNRAKESEYKYLQECCEKAGMILQVGPRNDDCVIGETLFDKNGVPSRYYYYYKARWSKEPVVYVDSDSFIKQVDGSYAVNVYSNSKKVALLVNGTIFAFQGYGPEFRFQDISVKGFPVCLTAETEEGSMSVVCYGDKIY